MPLPIGVPIALTAAGLAASFLNKPGGGAPNISGELGKIDDLFAKLRAQSAVNINRESAQGRRQAANNMATRGVYSSPVSEHTFNAIEDSRLNALATSEAQIGGQEAEMRSGLLRQLLGMDAEAKQRKDAVNAGRWGAVTGIGSNLLLAQLLRGGGAPAAPGTPGVAGNFAGSLNYRPDWRQFLTTQLGLGGSPA